jgi:hypothetical protein
MNTAVQSSTLLAVALLAIMALGAMAWLLWTGASLLPGNVRKAVVVLRILGLAALLLAAFDPFWRSVKPDPSAYRVTVLADVSRSMETRDLPDDVSRLEWLSAWMQPVSGSSALQRLAGEGTPVSVRLFSDVTRSWDGRPVTEPIPGQTGIGDALAGLVEDARTGAESRLGGVLLLSDGMNLAGRSPVDAARLLGRAGIPVSVIGIGESTTTGDVRIAFTRDVHTIKEGQSASASIRIENTFQDTRGGRLAVYQNNRLLKEGPVELAGGEVLTEEVPIDPSVSGVDTLRAVFEPGFTGGNPSTNTSFSIAEIERPDHFRILLMSGGGGWSERMLRILALGNDSISMDSLIRIDEQRFFLAERSFDPNSREPLPVRRETLNGIPDDAEFYRAYDALILDRDVLEENADLLSAVLREFTGTKGGGVLLIHSGRAESSPDGLPQSLRNLFPAREIATGLMENPGPLQFEADSVFADYLGGVLFADPPPRLPGMAVIGQPAELSRAAQVPVRIQPGNLPLLVTQAYGAGRSAWLASDETWRWRMGSKRAAEQYAAFWEAVLSWLAVGGKDRLEAPLNATIVPMDAPVDLGIRILGQDYTPRMDASVTALLTGPDGRSRTVRLQPSIDEPGRYVFADALGQPGTWQVDYTVIFPDGDELRETAWFAMAATSPESRRTAFQEKTLRDIARISGGQYRSFREWEEILPLPVSDDVPVVEVRIHWTRTWPFLLAAAILFLAEWWLRRRHGLR